MRGRRTRPVRLDQGARSHRARIQTKSLRPRVPVAYIAAGRPSRHRHLRRTRRMAEAALGGRPAGVRRLRRVLRLGCGGCCGPRACRVCPPLVAVLRHAELLQPHPPHRLSQPRRAARPRRRHSVSHPVPRRADRRAGAEPARAGRDHRRRHRRRRDGGDRLDHHRSRTGCWSCRRARATARPTIRSPATNSRSIRSGSAPVLRRLVSPTKTRARIYDRDGSLIVDSRNLYGRGDVLRFDLPPPTAEKPGLIERTFIAIRTWLGRGDLPRYRELGPDNGKGYPEVLQALAGQHASIVRIDDRGRVIVSVAVPVQRSRAVRGALLLSDPGRRHRPDRRGRAPRDPQGVPDRRRHHGRAVGAAREHHRRSGAPAGRRRRARAPAHQEPRRDPRLHPPPRRDRASVRRAARHDQRAVQPHRGDRELRRRRRRTS